MVQLVKLLPYKQEYLSLILKHCVVGNWGVETWGPLGLFGVQVLYKWKWLSFLSAARITVQGTNKIQLFNNRS